MAHTPTPRYELFLATDRGDKICAMPTTLGFQWTERVNAAGWATLNLPGSFDLDLFAPDRQVQIWRYPRDQTAGQLAYLFFTRKWNHRTLPSGDEIIRVGGPDPTELVMRRIVAYAAFESETEASALEADDAIKDVIDENLISATDTDRNVGGYGFSVSLDLTAGSAITKSFAWRNALQVIQEMADAGGTEATRTLFRVLPMTPTSFQFVTWVGQRRDRGWGVNEPTVFSLARGNLEEPELEFDYSSEINYVYVGGPGEGANRITAEDSDADAIGQSIWNRREAFIDARREQTAAGLAARAEEALRQGKAKRIIRGRLVDTGKSRLGRDWDLGDRVAVEIRKQRYNVLVEAVRVAVDGSGAESIDSRFEVAI